jgi:hypothetical protein
MMLVQAEPIRTAATRAASAQLEDMGEQPDKDEVDGSASG